ncbi:hypothetical protein ACWGPD_21215, partial [Streptomyces hirsutus]
DIAAALRTGLEARGWKVHALETAPLSARFTVTDPSPFADQAGDELPCPCGNPGSRILDEALENVRNRSSTVRTSAARRRSFRMASAYA